MAFKIIWAPKAKETFFDIINYLELAWGEKQITEFVNQADHILDFIKENPYLFKKSEIPDVHQVLITKHNILFYQINQSTNTVELMLFWDTRQNPSKLKSK